MEEESDQHEPKLSSRIDSRRSSLKQLEHITNSITIFKETKTKYGSVESIERAKQERWRVYGDKRSSSVAGSSR
jgi:hypothetical protein